MLKIVFAYFVGWLTKEVGAAGAISLDNLMEDAATVEICWTQLYILLKTQICVLPKLPTISQTNFHRLAADVTEKKCLDPTYLNQLVTLVFKSYKPQNPNIQTHHVLLSAKHLLHRCLDLGTPLHDSFVIISEQTSLLDNSVYFSKLWIKFPLT